ncbi:putative RPL14B-ribosomal protein [Exidia glandulosa HHB12029]|uniref:Putative RPL14B-ribosomal protein n=1 Tax=Exidia glandulosa HHB12029 TaxID=1314781 RepID=A0A165CUN6_EXIGL|nr:putative RPL14B-ribosomal protein [Exidia glandulosa HHB12029]
MPAESTFKRFVEVGRIVLLKSGPSAGKTAVIVDIIDHNRALIDNPAAGVPRQSYPYRHLTLTPLTSKKLPRGAGSGTVKKVLEAEGIAEKWAATSWAKRRAALERRRALNDFERFGAMLEKRKRRDGVRKSVKAAKKA